MNKQRNRAYHIFPKTLQIKKVKLFQIGNSVIILFIIDAHSLTGTKRGASHTIPGTFAVTLADYFTPAAYV